MPDPGVPQSLGMTEIQKADPKARRRALTTLILAASIGGATLLLIEHFRPALEEWIMQNPAELTPRIIAFLAGFVALGSVPLLAFALYFWRFGSRVAAAERFPPPGFAVVRDTPVLRGPAARGRGHLARTMAASLALLACIAPVIFWWVLQALVSARGG